MTDPDCSWKSVGEMAVLLKTTRKTVRRAAERGSLESIRLGPRMIRVRLPRSIQQTPSQRSKPLGGQT